MCIIIQGYFSQICGFETGYPAADGMRRRLPRFFSTRRTHTHTHIMCTHAECAPIPHRRLICSGYRPGTEQKLEVLRQLRCLPPAYRIKGGRRRTGDTLPRQNDKEAFGFFFLSSLTRQDRVYLDTLLECFSLGARERALQMSLEPRVSGRIEEPRRRFP